MKRVIININSAIPFYGQTHLSGIGRTTFELIQALSDLKNEIPLEIVLYSQKLRRNFSSLEGIRFKHLNYPVINRRPFSYITKVIPPEMIMSRFDLLHIPNNYEVVKYPEKLLLTIHDVLFFRYPNDFKEYNKYRAVIPPLAKRVKAIVTCSEASKDDIVNYLGVNPNNVTVIPWGIKHNIFKPMDNLEAKREIETIFKISRPFFLSVSCSMGRKNTIATLKAHKKALSANCSHDLVLVWGEPPQEILELYANEISEKRMHFLKHVNDVVLADLYNASTATFFPSRYEGFGLPVLESMACGTPVVTCNNSAINEVAGNAVIFVDPDDINEMTDIMLAFDKNIYKKEAFVAAGLKQAAGFTWEATAMSYAKLYHKLLS